MLIYVSACLLLFAQAQGLLVNTTEGTVQGSKSSDGNYYAFYDIPYAGPTEGSNRFKAPVPPSAYTQVFNATNRNVTCAQPTSKGLVGIENCLTLSIFTKNVTTPKPVIMFLNSEEYTTSYSQAFSFKKFVEENVVFISINFRLSIFGFLCLGVREAPGNAGLKDVVQGLKWINANIANFGGNPSNVVLMGHGSGAAMVDILTMTPQTNNLIHKAVALSGSALAPWAVAYKPIAYAKALGRNLRCPVDNLKNLAQNLTTTDINVLISSINQFHFTNNTPLFAPCIENPSLNANDTVLNDAPIKLLRTGNYSQIPYIAGYTTEEGTMRATEGETGQWPDEMERNFKAFLPADLNLSDNKAAVIHDFYFDDDSANSLRYFFSYEGDTLIVVPVIRGVRERGWTSSSDVRLFEFDYMGMINKDWIHRQVPGGRVNHGAILNYLFDYNLKPSDEAVMRSVVKRFARFAYTGNPTANTGARNSTPWPALTLNTINYLYFGGNTYEGELEDARADPDDHVLNFWNNIYSRYYVPPKAVGSSAETVQPVAIVGCLLLLILSRIVLGIM